MPKLLLPRIPKRLLRPPILFEPSPHSMALEVRMPKMVNDDFRGGLNELSQTGINETSRVFVDVHPAVT
jgi:hypothetical protein